MSSIEEITQETLLDLHTTISIGVRPICSLRFADDIDLNGGSNNERQDLTGRLVKNAAAYGMEVGTEKSKVMVSSTDNISAEMFVNAKSYRK